MLDNLIISINAILPVCIFMIIGVLVRRIGLLNGDDVTHFNRLVFKVFFAIFLFYTMYRMDFSRDVNPSLMLFCGIIITAEIFVAGLIVCHFVSEPKRRGAMIHSLYRSNFIIMGAPILANIYGPENLAPTMVLVTIVIPLYNIYAVIIFETFRGRRAALLPVLKGIAQNPMIVGLALGAAANYIGLQLPNFLTKPAAQISTATPVVALMMLGASFNLENSLKDLKTILICTAGRLIFMPCWILVVAYALGIRGQDFMSLIVIFATPCAVVGFAMSQQMESDYNLTGSIIITTTALGSFTLFLWIFLAKTIGMF